MSLSKEEKSILDSIVNAENDSSLPTFPVTKTYQIDVPGFSNVWLKDESSNLTGTHKDRMAWEIVQVYKRFLLAKLNHKNNIPLPHMSIISSGSAAVAIQTQLRKFNLPSLKILVDTSMSPSVLDSLKKMGCIVYKTDLGSEILNWQDILELTSNKEGFDITSLEALEAHMRFYDWMSYEIINDEPEYCFLPFGSGILYENLLNTVRKEITSEKPDPVLTGNIKKIATCNFFGATTNDPNSKAAEKLYAPHKPFTHFNEQWIRFYRYSGYCGPESDVHLIQEKYLDEAIAIAHKNGITCEPSGIAGLALMLQLKNKLPRNKKMLIVNTGKVKYPN